MIVTCERCATQFQLDDERVPEDGVRVRCSRCKHAFFIERPARNEVEKVHRIARRALEDTPEATQDLGAGAAPDAPEEEDWQFADDAPFGSEADDDPNARTMSAVADAVDDLLEGPSAAEDSGSTRQGFAAEDLALAPEAGGDGESLAVVDATSEGRGAEPAGPAPDAEAPGAAAALVQDDDAFEPSLEDSGLELADTGTDSESSAELGGAIDETANLLDGLTDQLGELGELDGPTGQGIRTAGPLPAMPEPPPRREVVTRPTRTVAVPQDPDELEALEDWGLPEEDETEALPTRVTPRVAALVDDEPSVRSLWLARAGNLVGWVCVAALFALGLHSGVAIRPTVPAPALDAVAVGGFELSQVDTTWVDNLHVGPLLVISGRLRNEAAVTGTGVEAQLLGVDGVALDVGRVEVGPAIGEAMLRASHPDALAETQRSLRKDGWPWRPGEERRFVAVGQGVPAEAAWLRFGAVQGALTPPLPAPADSVPASDGSSPALGDSSPAPDGPSPTGPWARPR